MNPQPVAIPGSEMYTMTAQYGRTYRITVSLPPAYGMPMDSDWPFHNVPPKWPIIYVLDGNWFDSVIAGIVHTTSWCGSTSDAIVVGIGYPDDADIKEAERSQFVRRAHDLTPIYDEAVEKDMEIFKRPAPSGDAGNFHRFIKDEVIPFIETTYQADPARRILVGHSYGGLFGLFSLFTTPDLFDTLVIGSPTLFYGKRFTFQQEEAFAREHRQLPVKMYLFAAEDEESVGDTTLTDTLRMAAILQSRKYEGFSLVKTVFADHNHCEVAVPGIHWGLMRALRAYADKG